MDEFAVKYGYLIFNLAMGVVWLAFFLVRKDLRKELLWISSIMTIAGLTERFFVPVYWSPGSVFDLINTIGFGIESFLFAFFASGIAGVSYEVFARRHLRRGHFKHTHYRMLPVLAFFVVLLIMIFNDLNIHLYSLVIPAALIAVLIGLHRSDLRREILWGGVFFAVIYLLLCLAFTLVFPNYLESIYNLPNLWGIFILDVPLEEVIFAFSIGAMLSPMYEYVQGYRVYFPHRVG